MQKTDQIEAVYRREGPRLLAWLKGRVGDEAPDVLQDVMTRALAHLDALEPVRDLAAWFWRAVRNRVIDLWRARGRSETRADLELDDLVDEAWRDAADAVDEDEVLEALAEAIEALPPLQRDVIVAQSLSGETFASISQRTGVPPETLGTRKRAALANLRRTLEEFL